VTLPRLALLTALLAAALSTACGGSSRPRVLVAAASDLRFAFEEMEPLYEERCECDLVFTFGSSGLLSTQIAQGLRVDVFASADEGYVDDLQQRGLLLEGSRQLYALGRIVMAAPAASSLELASLEDLRDPALRTIAIANPEHAPYGRAAQEALVSAGVWEVVRPRLVLSENASLAAQFVETRNADAGVIPLSLAIARRDFLRYVLLDETLHEPLRQVAAVLSSSREPELATGFLDFVNGAEGRELMRRFGFVLPGESLHR
jgi:molybdate transport system substrate-binding protein